MKLIPKKIIQKYCKTAGERNEIDEILEPVLLAQRFYGLQILDPEWTWKKYGIYRIVSLTLNIYIILGTLDVSMNTTDLNLIIEGLFTMIVMTSLSIKSILFANERSRFQANYIKAKIYIFGLVKKYPEKHYRVLRYIKLFIKILVFVIVSPITCYLLMALWSAFNGNRVTLSRSTSSLMPMTSPYYELGLLIHLYFLTEAAFCLLVIDMWFIIMCMFFIEASEVSVKILEVRKGDDLYAKRLDDSLREFYVLHVEMMEFLNLINHMFKWISLVPVILIIAQTSLFLMLITEEINLQVAFVMLPASGEIFAYNWFGDRTIAAIENVNMALLHFDWTGMNLKDQKKYYIMTCYMNKSFGIKTAFGNDLSLLTLSSIYKMSYQMFTVFRTT